MFIVEDLHFESDVQEAIETLPQELPSLYLPSACLNLRLSLYHPSYGRILDRICGDAKSINQRRALRILQWVIVAQRPLKRYEIESAIVLDERITRITAAERPRGDVLSLCSPILEVEDGPDGKVGLFHFTAVELVFILQS